MNDVSPDSPKRAPFARDEPVGLDRDAFGHSDYVRALASIVTDDDAPSTVGVFGPWGVGKSTIVEGLPSELPEGTSYVYFDAWKYEADSLRRQFLRDCASQLEAEDQLDDFSVDENLAELDVDTQKAREGLALSWRRAVRAALFGLLVGAAVFALLSLGVLADFIQKGDFQERLTASVAAILVATMASLLNQIVVVTETVVTRRSLQDPDRFAERFAALLGAVKSARLVIVIDNLDRCAPAKAVEMLSTIKTYLEPTIRGSRRPASRSQQTVAKQVTFVVSVDDAALRRHLIAQEMQRSQTTADPDQARKYVDEYLAKFFSARLPIRPILPDDIRHYIEENLSPLIKAREVGEGDGRSLVGLVTTGLRRNPRQVKQFVNDLESRLRLLQERETPREGEKPGIAPAVSGEVVMIAKLALLESEFPREFERLQGQPRKLGEWHAAADSNSEVWIDEKPDPRSAEEQVHAEAFASFLQASRSIQTDNLRALLYLKQATEEAGLPGFQQFRDAVVNEDQPEVERLFAEASPEEQRGYAERMPQLLRDELGQGYLPAARAVVRVVISVEGLFDFTGQRVEVLETALNDPKLRDDELVFLDPKALLRAGVDLTTARQKELVGPVVTRFAGEEKSPEERRSAAEALAPFTALLDTSNRQRVVSALEGDLKSAFDLYVALAQADAGLLASGVGRAALDELAKPDEQGRNALLGRDAAFSVATVALEREADAELDQSAMDLVMQSLDGTAGDPEAFSANAERALALLQPLTAASAEQWGRLAEHIQAQWDNYPREHNTKTLELAQHAMSHASEETRTAVSLNLAPLLFAADPAQGVALIGNAKDSLIAELKRPVVDQLVQIGSQHVGERLQAAVLIRELTPEDAGTRLVQVVIAAVQQNQEESAIQLLAEQHEVLGEHREQIAEDLLGWAEGQIASGIQIPYAIFARLSTAMSAEQLERLAGMVVRRLQEANEEASQALDGFAGAGADRALEEVVARAVDALEGAGTLDGATAELLRRIVQHVGSLSDADQERLGRKLQGWLDALDQRSTAVGAIRSMRGLRAKTANPLVGKLIEASHAEVNESEAVQALLAARAISGAKNTRAIRRLNAHLKELENGSDEDQAVARAFRKAESP